MCLRLSISIRIGFLQLGLPRSMPRPPSYPYTTYQRYEDSDLSESDQSFRFRQPLVTTQPLARAIARPISALASYQPRPTARPVSRRNRPNNNNSYGQMPVSSRTHSDVKEIYRRKSLQQSAQDDYMQEDYDNIDQCFYKSSHLYPLQSKKSFYSVTQPNPQPNYMSPMDNNPLIQVSVGNEQLLSEDNKIIPHIPCNRNSLTRIPSGTGLNAVKANPKRYPVTAKAPRFFKKTSSATTCKVPSNDCTQTINQSNADGRKDCEKEIKGEQLSPHTKNKVSLERHHSFPVNKGERITRPLTAPSQDNASVRSNRIESALKRYEEIVHGMETNQKIKTFETLTKGNNEHMNMLSSSNKSQDSGETEQEKNNPERVQVSQKQSPRAISSSLSSTQKNDPTPTVLQTMLQELMQKGCVNKIPESSFKTETDSTLAMARKMDEESKKFNPGIIGDSVTDDESKIPKSINYQEMQNSIKKTSVVFQMGEPGTNCINKEIQVPSSPRLRVNPPSIVTQQTIPLSHNTKLNANESYSMELHRSKSYIVNLIDRALSKELGTVPEDRINCYTTCSKGLCNNDPKSLMEVIEKHSKKTEPKDFSLDLSNAFSESHTTNEVAHTLEIKEDCMCPCSGSHGEEPNYIKQLKQLRWGHLKHIQTEVKRLADLERFLDSCCNYE
ncbi:uncharacterized protein LOC112905104 isoform X2 [Agrilus planipennis]|nr:uncharacterized protein LOC112905104 isoform X2 [Agrilus planipennis]